MTANTPRARMSAKRRHHIFWENSGICCLCGIKIDCYREKWIVEHIRPLALLGPDTNPNCGPAHFACVEAKTHKQDLPRIRKAKSQQEACEVTRNRPPKLSALPTRPFYAPAGVVYDWKRRSYIKQAPEA